MGSENLRHSLQPIRCKTKINHDLVTRVFPRFRQFFTLSSDWLLTEFSFILIGRCDYFGLVCLTLNLKALK